MDNQREESANSSGTSSCESPQCNIWASIYFEHGIVVEERFRSHGRLENLENAIVDYEKAVKYAEPNHGVCRSNYHRRLEDALVAYREKVAELTQDSHPDEAIRHYKLGDASLERFSRHGKLEDLDKAISSLWKAIKLAPDGHLEQANFRNRLGDALLARFERLDSIGDLDGAISSYQKAVDLTPDDVHKPPHLHRLGGGLEARFNRLDDLEALDGAVSTHQQAVELTLDDHPDKPLFLDGLAHAQEVRFKRLHDLKDMENAVSSKRKAYDLTPEQHQYKQVRAKCLEELEKECIVEEKHLKAEADAKRLKEERNAIEAKRLEEEATLMNSSSLESLESKIPLMQKSIKLTSEDRDSRLMILGDVQQARFKRLNEAADINSAISNYQWAVDLTPDHHKAKPSRLMILGDAFRSRFRRFGKIVDMDSATSNYQRAVDLTPDDHSTKISYLSAFRDLKRLEDFDSAISNLEKSIKPLDKRHPDRPNRLIDLAMAYQARFERLGMKKHLKEAISNLKEADEITTNDHPSKALCHYSLGDALRVRFEHFGKLERLGDAISKLRKSVEMSPDEPRFLNGYGRALLTLFEHQNKLEDLESAISHFERAVKLSPQDHPRRPHYLHDLGNALRMRFERLNKPEDLENSILNLHKSSELMPNGHPDKPVHLNGLGVAYLVRFEGQGSRADLERAISTLQEADALMLDVHPSKPSILSNRGRALRAGYERMRKLEDLNTAIQSLRTAAEHRDDQSGNLSHLLNLAVALQERFERFGSPADLESLISSLKKVVTLMADNDPNRANCLNTLGKAHKTRYELLGIFTDLDRSILNLQHAVAITPDNDPYKAHRLNNLGSVYSISFDKREMVEHLQEAVSVQDRAVELTPDGHPNGPTFLSNYGDALYRRSNSLGDPEDRKSALKAFTKAAKSAVGHPRQRFDAALKWVQCCRDSKSAFDAYTCVINLLPQIASPGLAVADQHALLAEIGGVARDAVAAAIEAKNHKEAIEWAEHGRSIVWRNLLSLRTLLDDLRPVHPELADSFQEISQQMEAPHSDASLGSQKAAPTDKVARLHLELARKWEEILKRIRSKPAFESFLKPKSFGKLDAAASDGPVVILNVQENRCDALVLIKGRIVSSVKHIHLERFSYQAAEKLLQQLKAALSSAGLRARSVRAHHWVKPKTDASAGLRGVLRTLWLDVVEPVLQGLGYKVELKKPPRIWWCPTGPLAFLPIHAAGLYDTASVGRNLSDYVVSSYTPTLTAILSEARSKAKSFKLLAVALPLTPYASSLPYTTNEIERIQKLTTKTSLVELTSESATVKRVVEEMKASDWVHLACHGEQVIEKAMKSGLLLHDKKLELSEMIKLSLPRAEFAFLSACQTATGDEKVAEESVHLASGMLFAGYRGLIATMWSINDKDAPQVAEDVYQRILKDGKPKREEAARALHDAVKRLREESNGDMLSWVPFIHIGR